MKRKKPITCENYGRGECPFDFAGGICPDCPESFLAFLVTRFAIGLKKLAGSLAKKIRRGA